MATRAIKYRWFLALQVSLVLLLNVSFATEYWPADWRPEDLKWRRQLPATLQMDLIFPRNETYSAGTLFPLIFVVKGLPAVWPMGVSIYMQIRGSLKTKNGEQQNHEQIFDMGFWDFRNELGGVDNDGLPGEFFYFTPTMNVSEVLSAHYKLGWTLGIEARCLGNDTRKVRDSMGNEKLEDEFETWIDLRNSSNSPLDFNKNLLEFSISTDGQEPNLETLALSCLKPEEHTSLAVHVTDFKFTNVTDREAPGARVGTPCAVFDTTYKSDECAYKDVARDFSANISQRILAAEHCFNPKADWRSKKLVCPEVDDAGKRGMRRDMAQLYGVSVLCWLLLLVL